MQQRREDAVSPVVGVMLMLVVTIIIAAVVSAFAGGVSSSTDKAPNAQIQAGYSQLNGFWMENNGPDDVSTMSTNVYIRLSDSFGNAEHFIWAVNKSMITIGNKTGTPLDGEYWFRSAGYTGVKSWKVGERHYVMPPNHLNTTFQPNGPSAIYRLDNPANQGNSFWVELTDRNGKMFARTKVKIAP